MQDICLEFANTADWHGRDEPVETLHTYGDLVAWSRTKGLVTAAGAEALRERARRHAGQAQDTLQEAIELREAVFRIFAAIAAGASAPSKDIATLNAFLQRALPHLKLAKAPEGMVWAWEAKQDALDQVLWPVVRSAADLLTGGPLERVGMCADDAGCGWLFLDLSKNRSRRWCDMKGCGNRAKLRRFSRREKRQ